MRPQNQQCVAAASYESLVCPVSVFGLNGFLLELLRPIGDHFFDLALFHSGFDGLVKFGFEVIFGF